MAQLSSRLIISLVDKVSGPARGIGASLKALNAQARAQPFQTIGREAKTAGRQLARFAGTATTAGYGLYSFINATDEFNESKFGYGFARLTDHMKDGRLEMRSWKKDMDATGEASRKTARKLGLLPETVMRARAEVEKLGLEGNESQSVMSAALGLHMSETEALSSGSAAQFLASMYRAYETQRDELAKKIGKDAKDPAFIKGWIDGIAAKAAVAGAESALGPADLIEGLRQYAPQWAQMGITPEFAMAAIAHGSNYGFRAPELGTSFKSMASRAVKPTGEGLRWMNSLGIDRKRFMNLDAADPERATNQLQSLLGGQLKKADKATVKNMLREAQAAGTSATPEFQEQLTSAIGDMLGRKTEQDIQDIQLAVNNATLTSGGKVDIPGLIKELIDKKAGPAALMSIFEGKHYARGTPMFEYWEKLYNLFEKLQGVDGTALDAVKEARISSEAGTADALAGAWKDLLLAMQQTGVIESVKSALTSFADALRAMPSWLVSAGTQALVLGATLTTVGFALGGVVGVLRTLAAAAMAVVGLVAGGTAATTTGALTGLATAGGLAAASKPMWGPTSSSKLGNMGPAPKAGGFLSRLWGGAKSVGKIGGRAIPFLGWGLTAYSLWDYLTSKPDAAAHKANGDIRQSAAAARTSLAPRTSEAASPAGQSAPDGQQIVTSIRSAMDQVRGIVAGVDLFAEGQRIVQSLADGMMSKIPQVQAAGSAAAAAASRSALRGSFTDGGR